MAKQVIIPVAEKYLELSKKVKAINLSKIKSPVAVNLWTSITNPKLFLENTCAVMLGKYSAEAIRETQFEHLNEFLEAIKK